jgi:hypothetical protein
MCDRVCSGSLEGDVVVLDAAASADLQSVSTTAAAASDIDCHDDAAFTIKSFSLSAFIIDAQRPPPSQPFFP